MNHSSKIGLYAYILKMKERLKALLMNMVLRTKVHKLGKPVPQRM